MITAASLTAPIAPGMPGKAASPGGGEAFALSMLAIGAGIEADAPAAPQSATRQAVAVPGIALPTRDAAAAIDPAPAWLPTLNVPIDLPPALANVAPVAGARAVAPTLRGSASVGTLAVTLPAAAATDRVVAESRDVAAREPLIPLDAANTDIVANGAPVADAVPTAPFVEPQDVTGEAAAPSVKPKLATPARRDRVAEDSVVAPERPATPSPAAVGPTLEADTGGETRSAEPMPASQPDPSGTLPPVVAASPLPEALPPVDAPPVEAPRGKRRASVDGASQASPPATAPLAAPANQLRAAFTRVAPPTLQPSTAPTPVPVTAEANDLAPADTAATPPVEAQQAPDRPGDRLASPSPKAAARTHAPTVHAEPHQPAIATPAADAPIARRETADRTIPGPVVTVEPSVTPNPSAAAPLNIAPHVAEPSVATPPPVATPRRSGPPGVDAPPAAAAAPLNAGSLIPDTSAPSPRAVASSLENAPPVVADTQAVPPSHDPQVIAAPVRPVRSVPDAATLTRAVMASRRNAAPVVADAGPVTPSRDPQTAAAVPLNATPLVPDGTALTPRPAAPLVENAAPVMVDGQAVAPLRGPRVTAAASPSLHQDVPDAVAPTRAVASRGHAAPAAAAHPGMPSPDPRVQRAEAGSTDAQALASGDVVGTPQRPASMVIDAPVGAPSPVPDSAAAVIPSPGGRDTIAAPVVVVPETPIRSGRPVTARADAVTSLPIDALVADIAVAAPAAGRSSRAAIASVASASVAPADIPAASTRPASSDPVAVAESIVAAAPAADRQMPIAEPVRAAPRTVPDPAPVRSDTAAPVIAAAAPVAVAGAPIVAAPALAMPAPRQSFVREVTGGTRQSVALPPRAAVPQQPAAGVTAPAARVFGAAIHAARGNDERKPTELVEGAPMPLAGLPPVTGSAPVADIAQPALDMRQNDWPGVMIDRIEALRDGANANDTRIRLVPDALGAITVAVKTVGDAIHVRFAAEDTATRTLIEEAQPRLVAIAEERGLKIGQTLVEVTPTAQQNAAQQNGGQQAQGQSGQPSANANGQQNAAQSQAQNGQQTGQQPRQHTPSARQPASPARAPSNDTDAAGNGRIA